MQEASQKLGFYFGEEDMEFSSFSSGTERVVKTWQASLDAPQDGIVTAELLEQLVISCLDNKGSTLTATQKQPADVRISYSEPLHRLKHSNSSNGCVGYVVWEDTNGAAVTSGTEISEVQQTLVKEGVTKVEVSKHLVFLLGENRWKDSSRLSRNQKNSISCLSPVLVTIFKFINHCLATLNFCRSTLNPPILFPLVAYLYFFVAECDGTGEPNIEEQFLDWVEREQNVHIVKVMGLQFAKTHYGILEFWKRSLNPLTWTEILRQVLAAAGFGSKQGARRRDALSKEMSLMVKYGLRPGTLKGELFRVLLEQGIHGFKVSELAKSLQISELNLSSGIEVLESLIGSTLSSDITFEKISSSTYRVRINSSEKKVEESRSDTKDSGAVDDDLSDDDSGCNSGNSKLKS
ncbi:unnamed protein product [Prunus armeniaca]